MELLAKKAKEEMLVLVVMLVFPDCKDRKESRETKDCRVIKDPREFKETRDYRATKDLKDPRNPPGPPLGGPGPLKMGPGAPGTPGKGLGSKNEKSIFS